MRLTYSLPAVDSLPPEEAVLLPAAEPLSVLLVPLVPLVLLLEQPASITPAIVIEAIAVMIFLYFIINSS